MPARAASQTRRHWLQLGLLHLPLLHPALGAQAQSPLLELNQADRAELESLPGIGPQLAERLLAERARALFNDWPDLLRRVRGLGPSLARRLSGAGLRINGHAYEAPAPQER
ncbi:ComEA family DNA-binding protein [Roseateles sp.]|jgi:competence protein ComEA|uniref:ComEA family DNA-binding protein n=1 Tax=Roseateles sp. TaxID=1971397 RepID=UPI00391DD5FD